MSTTVDATVPERGEAWEPGQPPDFDRSCAAGGARGAGDAGDEDAAPNAPEIGEAWEAPDDHGDPDVLDQQEARASRGGGEHDGAPDADDTGVSSNAVAAPDTPEAE